MSRSPHAIAEALADTPVEHFDVAVIVTGLDGAVGYWNRAAERLYGWSRSEAVGRNVIEMTPASQSRARAEEILRTLAAGTPWAGDIALRRRDGTVFMAFVANTPLPAEGPGMSAIVGASAPAAARRRVEARNALLRYELQRRLERRGREAPEPPARGPEAGRLPYRCYLLDERRTFIDLHEGQFRSDREAATFAGDCLKRTREAGAELWQAGRLVQRL